MEPENRGQWFTDPAITYPLAISKYVYSVAKKLNENSKNFQADERFLEFSKTLISFLKDTDSHFATLNYDTLFYSAFNDGIEINGETVQLCKPQFWLTTLNDGYRTGTGFSKENFNRPPDRDFGFYLHLHGSPLFISDETKVKKLNRNELSEHTPRNAHHIVLSDGELKPLLITRSSVLAMYWKALEQAIDEAEEIILFGYGGFDRHLNHLIKTNFEKQIYVVEWDQSKHFSEGDEIIEPEEISADTFWKKALGDGAITITLDNILNFREWDDPAIHNIPF